MIVSLKSANTTSSGAGGGALAPGGPGSGATAPGYWAPLSVGTDSLSSANPWNPASKGESHHRQQPVRRQGVRLVEGN
jgi:hypothetical protein